MTAITIRMNGDSITVEPGTTVGDLVDGFGRGRSGVAVALGGDVIPRAAWDHHHVGEGDEVDVLTAAQGG